LALASTIRLRAGCVPCTRAPTNAPRVVTHALPWATPQVGQGTCRRCLGFRRVDPRLDHPMPIRQVWPVKNDKFQEGASSVAAAW
jgi:hypothetical protein